MPPACAPLTPVFVAQAIFTLLLGPFTFFDIQKTKYLQILTSLMRWIGESPLGPSMTLLETARRAHGPRRDMVRVSVGSWGPGKVGALPSFLLMRECSSKKAAWPREGAGSTRPPDEAARCGRDRGLPAGAVQAV